MPRRLACTPPNLAILPLPSRPTMLPSHADRCLPLRDNARLSDHPDALGSAHRVGHELMRGPPPVLLVPDHKQNLEN